LLLPWLSQDLTRIIQLYPLKTGSKKFSSYF
jgi:hypothetical protein